MGILDIINKTKLEKNTAYTDPLQMEVDVDIRLVNINNYLKSIYAMMYKSLPRDDEELISRISNDFDKYKHLTQFTFRVEFDMSVLEAFTSFIVRCDSVKCIFKKYNEENYLAYLTFDGESILHMIKFSDQFNKIFMKIKPLIRDIHPIYFKELIENNYVGESYFNTWELVNITPQDFIYSIVEDTANEEILHELIHIIEPNRIKLIGSGIYNEFEPTEINTLFRSPVIYSYSTDTIDYIEVLQGKVFNEVLHYGDITHLVNVCNNYSLGNLDLMIPSDIYIPFTDLIKKYYGVSEIDKIVYNVYNPYDANDESLYTEIIE